MSDFDGLMDNVYELVHNYINENMTPAKAKDLGLDSRAGYKLYVNDDCIAVEVGHCDRMLQYYGGFEYVDKEYRKEMGDYVFYMGNEDRVMSCIECFNDKESE